MNNIKNENNYLSVKKKEILKENSTQNTIDLLKSIQPSHQSSLAKKISYYIKEINRSAVNILKNDKYQNIYLIKMTYLLSKLYIADQSQNKIGTLPDVEKALEKICKNKDVYTLFKNEYNKIPLSNRYDYESIFKNNNINLQKNIEQRREKVNNISSTSKLAKNKSAINKVNNLSLTSELEKMEQENKESAIMRQQNKESAIMEQENKKSAIMRQQNKESAIIEPPKILVINYDEDRKRFLFSVGNSIFKRPTIEEIHRKKYSEIISKKINDAKPDLVVCCTQNSLSCTDEHFQHYFRDLMEIQLANYSLISKADATTENDTSKWSCSTKFSNESKPFNVRTRVYRNKDTLDANLSDPKIMKESVSGSFNKKSRYDEWYSPISGNPPIDKFYVNYIGFKRLTENIKGFGGIIYDIMICKKPDKNIDSTCYQNIFCNYNLKEASSKRILDAISFRPIFEGNNTNNEKIKNELQIFMITSNSFKTKKFLVGDKQNIFENNTKSKENLNKILEITKMHSINKNKVLFKRINGTKIINNVKNKKYEAKNKDGKNILKNLKIFNTNNKTIKPNKINLTKINLTEITQNADF